MTATGDFLDRLCGKWSLTTTRHLFLVNCFLPDKIWELTKSGMRPLIKVQSAIANLRYVKQQEKRGKEKGGVAEKRLTLEVHRESSVESAYFSPLHLSCHQLELATTNQVRFRELFYCFSLYFSFFFEREHSCS
jgi:hypothetical protein